MLTELESCVDDRGGESQSAPSIADLQTLQKTTNALTRAASQLLASARLLIEHPSPSEEQLCRESGADPDLRHLRLFETATAAAQHLKDRTEDLARAFEDLRKLDLETLKWFVERSNGLSGRIPVLIGRGSFSTALAALLAATETMQVDCPAWQKPPPHDAMRQFPGEEKLPDTPHGRAEAYLATLVGKHGLRAESFAELAAHLNLEIAAAIAHATSIRPSSEIQNLFDNGDDPLSQNRFLHAGGMWRLRFEGRDAYCRNTDGLGYLHELLGRPGHSILAIDLYGDADVLRRDVASKDPLFDDDARRAYEDALRDGDLGLEEQMEVEEYLRKGTALGGKNRYMSNKMESTRRTVGKSIDLAIRNIRRELPHLGKHFDASINTGTECSYRPALPAPNWEL